MISYLAIPYTWSPEDSFRIANKVAAKLMKEGKIIFSPISHSHVIADNLDESLRTNHDFWMAQDLPILKLCDELLLIVVGKEGSDLIANSNGCSKEILTAIENKIKINYYYDV